MKTALRSILLVLGLLGLSLAAHAQAITTTPTTTWTGGNSDFATGGNWSAGVPYFQFVAPLSDVGSIDDGSTVTVTSAVTFDNSQLVDTLLVGGSSNTTLDIQSSGSLDALFVNIGNGAGDIGTVNVSGTLHGGGPPVGVGVDGVGTLEVMSGGKVIGPVNVAYSAGSTGTLTLNSGASILTDTGVDPVNLGSIGGGDGNATVTLHDGSTVEGGINLGGVGSSTLTIDGSVTVGDNIVLQAASGGSVSAHLDGATVSPSGLLLEGDGANTLLIDNGAQLTMTNPVVSDIGGYGEGTSTVTVDGSGTLWTNSGQLQIGGTGGTGTLNVTNGATVSQQQITLGGGSNGNGTLNVLSGGSVTTDNALIGYQNDGYGSVTVDGSGSTLHVTSDFRVGDAGNGSVTVSNGGTLQNDAEADIGVTGTGSVLVTGSSSSWTSNGDITMAGGGGSGSITLTDGGQLTINSGNGTLYLNTAANGSGNLNIGADAGSAAAAPGFLSAATVAGNTSGGTAILTFNHTQTGSPYFFSQNITGGVFVVHKAGDTYLSGANDYSGGTFIGGGTVILGNNDALGTGDISFAGGTIDLNGHNQTSGILAVSGNTFIDFTNNSTLVFASSSGGPWTGTLTLLDFDNNDSLRFGTDDSGLLSGQLARIDINGFTAQIDINGFITASSTPFTAVPEPSTYAALAGLAALGLAAYRRRTRLEVQAQQQL